MNKVCFQTKDLCIKINLNKKNQYLIKIFVIILYIKVGFFKKDENLTFDIFNKAPSFLEK